MRSKSRIIPSFVSEQTARRVELKDSPGQAGGLPALNERVELLETILAVHAPE